MKVLANGVSFNCRVEGKQGAPWVTFSHSLACDLSMWDEQVEALENEFRLLRYDARGHGESGAPPGPYSFDMLIADVIGLWDALGIAKSHFVGLSLGGMTALGLALKHPERLLGMAVCDARADNSEEGRKAWAARAQAARAGGMDAVADASLSRWFTEEALAAGLSAIEKARGMIRGTSLNGYAGCADAIRELAYQPRLSGIRVPTLFVVGSEDPGTPPSSARAMHQVVAGSRLVEIEGAAHLSNLERPLEFNEAIGSFLRSGHSH